MTRQAYCYLRVSSTGQTDGHGYDRQRETIRRYAEQHGIQLAGEYADAYTGTDADRPAFSDMVVAILANGVRLILVESLDRLAREYRVQEQLIVYLASKDIQLVSANTGECVTDAIVGDPMKKAMVQIQGVFAELEKSQLVRKLRKARQAKKAQTGRCEGRKPYGAKPGEAEVVAYIRRLRRKPRGGERLSYAKIAERLNADGIPTRNGGAWRPSTVGSILSRV